MDKNITFGKLKTSVLKHMDKNITFGKLKISVLKHMDKNITFGIYKNILQLNNMGETAPRRPAGPSKKFQKSSKESFGVSGKHKVIFSWYNKMQFGTLAARWADLCVYGSPWLFSSGKVTAFTLVDRVNLHFEGVDSFATETAFWTEWKRLETEKTVKNFSEPCSAVVVDRTLYKPWEDLFTFSWDTLDLIVDGNKHIAFFRDTIGRTSVDSFSDTCNTFDGRSLTDSNVIHWLHCKS